MYTHRARPGSASPSQDPSASSSTSRPEQPGPSRAHAAPSGLSRRTVRRQEPVREGMPPRSEGTANRPQDQERPLPEFPPDRLAAVIGDCMDPSRTIHSDPPRSIKNLTAEQRTSLERILTSRFPPDPLDQGMAHLPEPTPRESHAMLMWLMVQSARLQTFSSRTGISQMMEFNRQLRAVGVEVPDRMELLDLQDPRVQHAQHAADARFNSAHSARTRPEYAEALNNLLRYLDPSLSLHPSLRVQVESAFNHHRVAGRISQRVIDMVENLGLATLARERYSLNPTTGNFKSEAQRAAALRGERFTPPPERPAENRPERASAQPELHLNAHEALWMNDILGFSSKPRSRIGKLPDSDQYQRIKSMLPQERDMLERGLEALFMNQGDRPVSTAAENALEAWLTTQQVRLRVHSEASTTHHEQATRQLGAGVKLMAAKFTGAQAQSENARFHSEHESANRPEYATAVNNFLRLLHPSTPIHPTLRDRIAKRFILHAEKEGTISAPVLEVMKRVGSPKNMAAAAWRLDPRTDAFSAPTVFVENMNVMAVPTPFARTPPRQR